MLCEHKDRTCVADASSRAEVKRGIVMRICWRNGKLVGWDGKVDRGDRGKDNVQHPRKEMYRQKDKSETKVT